MNKKTSIFEEHLQNFVAVLLSNCVTGSDTYYTILENVLLKELCLVQKPV